MGLSIGCSSGIYVSATRGYPAWRYGDLPRANVGQSLSRAWPVTPDRIGPSPADHHALFHPER